MRRLILALVGIALAVPAFAQQAVIIAPYTIRGQGVATATTSSAAITATLTLTANSAPFPTRLMDGGPIAIMPQGNASTGVYVCWQGGTCSAAVGEYLSPGQSRTVTLGTNMSTSPPTIIATASAAIVVEW
jgi:hypothetical protein